MEWRNENSHRAFPFYEPCTQIDPRCILDAVFTYNEPLYLTKTEVLPNKTIILTLNNSIEFTKTVNAPYATGAFGKIVIGLPPKNQTYTDLRFLDTLIFPLKDLQFPYTEIENGFTISLPYLSEATFSCVQSINGYAFKHFFLSRDDCTDVRAFQGGIIYLNDICKPPCYDCDARLTTGDVHQYISTLETRVDNIDIPVPNVTKNYTISYETTSTVEISEFSWVSSIVVSITEAFNGDKSFSFTDFFEWEELTGALTKFSFYKACSTISIVPSGTATTGQATITIEGKL